MINSFALYKRIQYLSNSSLAALITTFIVLLSCCNTICAQKKIEFSFVQANVDTTGWFFQFDTPIDPPRNKKNGAPIEDYEIAKAVFDFLSAGRIPPNSSFDPTTVETQGLPSEKDKYEQAYAMVAGNELIIRLSNYFDSGHKVYCFRRTGKQLVYLESTTPKARYFAYVSRTLHYQLLIRNARNTAIQRLQSSCGSNISPFFTQLSCIVKAIEENNLMGDSDFLESLSKIDPITYKQN